MSKIVKYHENFKSDLLKYLKHDEIYNTMFIGLLIHYEISANYEVYLQYDNERLTAAFCRYYSRGYVYSDHDQFNKEEMGSLINAFRLDRLSGKKEVINSLIPFLQISKIIEFKYSVLNDKRGLLKATHLVKRANINEIDKVLELIKSTHFLTTDYLELNTRKILNGSGRIYFIEDNGLVISSAETTAETQNYALIGEVTTHETQRNQGYATQVVSKLCVDLLNERKIPVLFYNNEKAGNVYHKLGFVDVGDWLMVLLENKTYLEQR